jgi:hypothetical protein
MMWSNGFFFVLAFSAPGVLGCGSVRGELPPDAASDAAHVVACDDGTREPGEVCYRSATTVNAMD